MSLSEIDVDNFAGGGGASTGLEAATGRPVAIAVNHCADAIAMHQANHPDTKHFIEDVWEVDPREVTVAGVNYRIVDIGLRMLQPRELFNAQGFPEDYVIDITSNGHALTKAEKIELCGNSVCPDVARAIVGANSFERWEAA